MLERLVQSESGNYGNGTHCGDVCMDVGFDLFPHKTVKNIKSPRTSSFEITSKVRGLKLAIKVLGARSYKEED